MIHSDLLRQLGWTEELINEVTRLAPPLRGVSTHASACPTLAARTSAAGTSICFSEAPGSSSKELRITRPAKPIKE